MNPAAMLGAMLGAAIGAGIWGTITYFTGYEIGYVAWAVGGLAGGGAVLLGGRGQPMAIVAALIALLGILGGKALATKLALKGDIADFYYEEVRADATAFAALAADTSSVRQFMVERGYTAAPAAEDVSDAELQYFNEMRAPMLRSLHENNLSKKAWRNANESQAFFADVGGSVDYVQAVTDSLGLLDLLFGFLGVSTAYSLVKRRAIQEEELPEHKT